jgi:uncharacterized protein YqjF (DUF2071 family)
MIAGQKSRQADNRDLRPLGGSGQWLWSQHWLDLLFAHWPVAVADLRPHMPAALDIDTYDGTAWVSLVAFRLERIRRRWLPSLRFLTDTLELNLRTYVRYRGEPAIFFLSIHAGRPLLVRLARWATPLDYRPARMSYTRTDGGMRFHSSRAAACGDLTFTGEFVPSDVGREALPGTLDEWLVERYCLYAQGNSDSLFRGVVRHQPWTVQPVTAQISVNTMGCPFDLDLSKEPAVAHYSRGVRAAIWPFSVAEKMTAQRSNTGFQDTPPIGHAGVIK